MLSSYASRSWIVYVRVSIQVVSCIHPSVHDTMYHHSKHARDRERRRRRRGMPIAYTFITTLGDGLQGCQVPGCMSKVSGHRINILSYSFETQSTLQCRVLLHPIMNVHRINLEEESYPYLTWQHWPWKKRGRLEINDFLPGHTSVAVY